MITLILRALPFDCTAKVAKKNDMCNSLMKKD